MLADRTKRSGAAAILAVVAGLAVAWSPSLASACSCAVGSDPELVVPSGPLPLDARGILVHGEGARWAAGPGAPAASPLGVPGAPSHARERVPPASRFTFVQMVGARAVPVPLEVWPILEPASWDPSEQMALAAVIASRDPLTPGRYRIGNGMRIGDLVRAPVEVTVSKDSMVAGTARLILGEPTRGKVEVAAGGSCSSHIEAAHRTVRIELPEQAKPFASALLYMTSVDGKLWRPSKNLCRPTLPGRSWRGDGEELLYTVCQGFLVENEGVTPHVQHTVQMRVHAPGSDIAIETPIETFTLECEPPAPAVSKAPPPPDPDRGCSGCTVGAGARPRVAPVLLALLSALLLARRALRTQQVANPAGSGATASVLPRPRLPPWTRSFPPAGSVHP